MSRWIVKSLVLAFLFSASFACAGDAPEASPSPEPPVSSQPGEPPAYEIRPSETPGGIGKYYMGREIARVMGHEGAHWLERPERIEEERPDVLLEILRELGARPGAVVADLGAGSGYFTLPLARRVGPQGTVYAVDVQPEMLDILRGKLAEAEVDNVELVLGAEADPRLPEGVVDLVLLVDVYHELEYPRELMQEVVRSLVPGGRVVLVEYRAEDPDLPIRPLHKMTETQVKREMTPVGLEWVETRDDLPRQHVLVFRKPRE